MSAAHAVAELGDPAVQEPLFLERAARVLLDRGALRVERRGTPPHLAEQLLGALLDAEFHGELPKLLQVVEEHGVREVDQCGRDADGVAVEVDQTESALGVGVPQEPGHLAVGPGDDEVAQGGLPGGVGPHLGDDGERHRQ